MAGRSSSPRARGGIPEKLIRRLLPETLTQMEAETRAFMAEYVPRVEREANRDWRINIQLFRDLTLHHFNQTAREVLGVCRSVEEFEEALLNEIPRFVEFTLSTHPFIAGPLQDEMDSGFALYCLRANLWAQIPDGEREKVWHVGAMTGETLSHAALNWRAEAWKRAAAGLLTNGEAAAKMESDALSNCDVSADATNRRAEARAAAVEPILTNKGWSIFEWATKSDVDFHTANDYLQGLTNPYRSTRKKLAETLGLELEKLPL
jgi:hypothetical protein